MSATEEKKQYLTALRSYRPPQGFCSRAAAKDTIARLRVGKIVLSAEQKRNLERLDGLLAAATLGTLIQDDEITLGMVKPRANAGIGLPPNDDQACEVLLAEIGLPNVALQFHHQLNEPQVAKFYGQETLDRLDKMPTKIAGVSVATEHLFLMTSGPASLLLLAPPQGSAVSWWREKMGATRPSQASLDSIRGRYATNYMLPNNLVHGSATIADVVREVEVFRDIVQDLLTQRAPAILGLLEDRQVFCEEVISVE